MIKAIILILFPFYLISATLTLNIAKDDNKSFSILHLDDTGKIDCSLRLDSRLKDQIVCDLDKRISKIDKPIEDIYFKIYFQDKKVIISPKFNFDIYSYDDDFIETNIVKNYLNANSKHWMIIGYKGKHRLFSKIDKDSLNFDIVFKKSELPYIGELDFDLKPKNRADDAKFVERIKSSFKNGDYSIVIDKCDNFLNYEFSNSEFKSIVKLYKLRAMDRMISSKKDAKIIDPMEFANLAKEWLDENPSNNHIAEVLSYISKAYIKMGRDKKANEYLDKLKIEFDNSNYYFDVLLFRAKKYKNQKFYKKAIKVYEDILYNTKDLDMASKASIELGFIYLENKDSKKASKFVKKVLKANPSFLDKIPKESFNIAKKFAQNKDANLSIEIYKQISKNKLLNKEESLKELGYWHEIAGDKKRALKLYHQYLKSYPDGRYLEFVKRAIDRLILDIDDINSSKDINNLDRILKEYKDTPLYKKAILKKSQILLENKKYKEILKLAPKIKEAGGIKLLKEVASIVFTQDLKEDKCKDALKLKDEYNLTTVKNDLYKEFACDKKLSKNASAVLVLNKLIKNSQDSSKKIDYMYELVKLYQKLGKYKELLLVSDDLKKLLKLQNSSKYRDLCIYSADAFFQIGGLENLMIDETYKCEKILKDDVRLIDLYNRVLSYAKKRDDKNMIINFAKKIVRLQDKYNLDTYTPIVELDLAEALRAKKKYQEALDVVLKLLYKKLNDKQRAHVLYLAGYLSEKLEKVKEAKEFYSKCGEIVEDISWVKLCSDSLLLIE